MELLVRYPDGREGIVREEDFANPEFKEEFDDVRVLSEADGLEYDGPVTHSGAVSRAARDDENSPAAKAQAQAEADARAEEARAKSENEKKADGSPQRTEPDKKKDD